MELASVRFCDCSSLDSVAERLVDLDLLSKLKSILTDEGGSLPEINFNVLSLINALLASSEEQSYNSLNYLQSLFGLCQSCYIVH